MSSRDNTNKHHNLQILSHHESSRILYAPRRGQRKFSGVFYPIICDSVHHVLQAEGDDQVIAVL